MSSSALCPAQESGLAKRMVLPDLPQGPGPVVILGVKERFKTAWEPRCLAYFLISSQPRTAHVQMVQGREASAAAQIKLVGSVRPHVACTHTQPHSEAPSHNSTPTNLTSVARGGWPTARTLL